MISASGSAPPSPAENDGCGVVAAISMPRSNAAVLTLLSTPRSPESFVFCESEDVVEVSGGEGDRGRRGGFWSGAMQKDRNQPGGIRVRARIRPLAVD